HLTEPDGSYRESVPPSLPRRQNPHMHAFEAMLAWHQCTADPRALPIARTMLMLLETHFLDRTSATIGEYYKQDWQRDGDSVEPGHLAEWAALIRCYERLTQSKQGELPTQLIAAAQNSADRASGLLADEISRTGNVKRGGHRLWPQTELARALIAESEAGVSGATGKALAALSAIA